MPIRITRSALGDDVPHADLYVTQTHAVLVDGVLVEAGNLVNGNTSPLQTLSASGNSYAQRVLGDSPVSYWRLDESSGTTAADQLGLNPGTYSGGYTLGVPGAIAGDSAVAFNGSTGTVTVPNSSSLQTGDVFSLEAWIKPARLGITNGILGK